MNSDPRDPARPIRSSPALFALSVAVALTFATGCGGKRIPNRAIEQSISNPTTAEAAISQPTWVETVRSNCRPPTGWKRDAPEKQSGSEHELWISPTGATAYGVIMTKHWLMALASDEKILSEFLKNMKASDGKADLLEKKPDPEVSGVGGIRFKVVGQKYTLNANLVSSGNRCWIVYVGTANAMAVNPAEVKIAEAARELTVTEPGGAVP